MAFGRSSFKNWVRTSQGPTAATLRWARRAHFRLKARSKSGSIEQFLDDIVAETLAGVTDSPRPPQPTPWTD